MSERELASQYFSLGLHIRNTFGLWQGNDEVLWLCHENLVASSDGTGPQWLVDLSGA